MTKLTLQLILKQKKMKFLKKISCRIFFMNRWKTISHIIQNDDYLHCYFTYWKKENSRWLASYNLSFYHCLWHIHGQVISQELEHIFKNSKNHKFSHMIDFSNNSTVWIWKNQTKEKNTVFENHKKITKKKLPIFGAKNILKKVK